MKTDAKYSEKWETESKLEEAVSESYRTFEGMMFACLDHENIFKNHKAIEITGCE